MSLSLYFNEDDNGYLAFDAEVRVGEFTGHTTFWVSRPDFERFLQELEALDRALEGEASLRCGWGNTVYFALGIRPKGHTGRLLVEVEVAAPTNEEQRFHRLQTSFVLPEPNALTRFRTSLRSAQPGSGFPAAMLTPAAADAGA